MKRCHCSVLFLINLFNLQTDIVGTFSTFLLTLSLKLVVAMSIMKHQPFSLELTWIEP